MVEKITLAQMRAQAQAAFNAKKPQINEDLLTVANAGEHERKFSEKEIKQKQCDECRMKKCDYVRKITKEIIKSHQF